MIKSTKHISTEQLVIRYQHGDELALQYLIKHFHPRLCSSVYYHTKNQFVVDDIVQDCWVAIINKLDSIELKISFEAWAFTIARRKSIDWIRKQHKERLRSQPLDEQIEDVSDEAKDNDYDQEKIIHEGIRLLSHAQRIVLTMFYLEKCSLRKISKKLHISEGTVKSRLFYAREELKKYLTNTEVSK